jgi:hypothetical protein
MTAPIAALGRTLAITMCLAVAACSVAPGATPSSTAHPSPSDAAQPSDTAMPAITSPSPAASASAVPTPPSTPVPSPTEPLHPSPPATSIKPGAVVETLVPDVRVRAKPRVTDSYKYEPLLPSGTKLYVVDGPVAASGYDWLWVAQLTSTSLPSGWVAAAGRDGEAWLGPSGDDCPAVPDDPQALLALPRGAGLACFSRVPITFKARLFHCNCDPTPGSDWIVPNWLFDYGDGPLIVDPSAVRPYVADGPPHEEGLDLLLDPNGRFPATLPIGVYLDGDDWSIPPVVTITGMFDHPAAGTCRWESHDPLPATALPLDPPVGRCRLEFAVTRIVVP